jgi:hypothetical protein
MIAVDSSVWIDFLTDRTTPQLNVLAAVCIREQATLRRADVDFDRLAAISELSTIKVG